MKTPMFETEDAVRLSLRAEARINEASLRVIQTGSQMQIVVMTLPPETATDTQQLPETDRLFVVADGVGEACVGHREFGIQPGDLVFVHAGTKHQIVNRTAAPLRLVAVVAPPAYPAGAVFETPSIQSAAGLATPAVVAR